MILITLGTQKFQFNRILKEIDYLVEIGLIKDEVFAQTGGSDYKPKHYEYKNFLDKDEMRKLQNEADIIITHGGTGSIIEAISLHKKVIVIPRLVKYGEHVDDHQKEITSEFSKHGYVIAVEDEKGILDAIKQAKTFEFKEYKSSPEGLINEIEKLILAS